MLFPEEVVEDSEQNVLLTTIRVPKNLLFLTDRLPRPNYHSCGEDTVNRHNTTTGDYMLPALPNHHRSSPYKAYIGKGSQKYKQILAQAEIHLKKLNQPIKRPTKLRHELKSNDPSPSPPEDNESPEKPVIKSPVEAPIKESPKQPHKRTISKVPENVLPDEPKDLSGLKPAKYRLRRKDKQLLDNLLNNRDYSPYMPDAYIRQIVSKRNPLVKPLNGGIQALANIYVGGQGQLSVASKRLGSIKLPKMLMKKEEYSLSPYVQRGLRGIRQKLLDGNELNAYNKAKYQALTPLKIRGLEHHKGEKGVDYEKELAAIVGTKAAHSLPPTVVSKAAIKE